MIFRLIFVLFVYTSKRKTADISTASDCENFTMEMKVRKLISNLVLLVNST